MFGNQIKSQLKRTSLLQNAFKLGFERVAYFSSENIGHSIDERPIVTITGVSGYVGS